MEPTETKTKRCTRCGAVKPVSEFYRNRYTREGLASWCKTCQRAAVRAHRQRLRNEGVDSFELQSVYEATACNAERTGVPRNADLARFTPRQLMRELYARGYEGELRYTQRINIASCKK